MKLNLGSGDKSLKGYTNVDKYNCNGNTKILHDLEKVPYPFKDNEVKGIHARCVLEHLNPSKIQDILGEWWRICKPNSIIYIEVPFEERWIDFADHKRGFSYNFFFRLCKKNRPIWDGKYNFDLFTIKNSGWGVGKIIPMRLRKMLATYLKGIIYTIEVELKVLK